MLRHPLCFLPVTVLALAAAGCGGGSKVTQANADKIKAGWTESAVTSLLGTPSQSVKVHVPTNLLPNIAFKAGGDKGPNQVEASQSTWKEGKSVITVVFYAGQVVSATFAEVEPPRPESAVEKLRPKMYTVGGKVNVPANGEAEIYYAPPGAAGRSLGPCPCVAATGSRSPQHPAASRPALCNICWTACGLTPRRAPMALRDSPRPRRRTARCRRPAAAALAVQQAGQGVPAGQPAEPTDQGPV
jgi:hypothetical protein